MASVERMAARKSPLRGDVTPRMVTAILAGKPQPLVERLCHTLQQAWNELDVLRAEAEDAGRRIEAVYSQERQGREKVLVVIEPDAFVQVFGESTVDARVQSLSPLDEGEAWLASLPQAYRELFLPGKVRATGMCAVRPEVTGEVIAGLLEWEQRLETNRLIELALERMRT